MTAPTPIGAPASITDQLLGLADFLKNPALPVSAFCHAAVQYSARDADEVDRVAAEMGVKAEWNEAKTAYSAEYYAGPNAAYVIIWHVPGHIDAWSAHQRTFRPEAAEVAA